MTNWVLQLNFGNNTNPLLGLFKSLFLIFDQIIGSIDRILVNIIPQYNIVKLGFRVLILLYIISFVREKFGGGALGTIAALVAAYVFIFQLPFLQFAVLAYIILTMGISNILLDVALANPFKMIGKKGKPEAPHGGAQHPEGGGDVF